ncbi:hypothetical protein Tco_0941840 [Tanacetum coccineum]|uniref:Uncharacterized protein n=1 Tax=Tanacetum coccineum TaxID=301880 RepID=A0ABQ5DS00_9ASTR
MSVLRSNAGWKTKDFKGMTFEQIEEKFILVWKSIQAFVPMDSQLESERLKRPGILLEKEKAKRLKQEQTLVEVTPQAVKTPICDWKIYRDKEVYQIFRIGQAPKAYPYFVTMLKDFDRDDVVTLWKLVKDRFKTELPKSDLEKCLFWLLKVMFKHVANDGMIVYMLDDVEYPLPKSTLQKMLDHKCEVSKFNEELIQMINLIRRQIKKV